MDNRFDDLASKLAGGLSRREALRTLGGGLAAALLASLGLVKPAHATAGNTCEKICAANKDAGFKNHGQCVSSCQHCLQQGGGFCPPAQQGGVLYCANTASDVNNCGGCGKVCFEGSTCQNGQCVSGNPGS